MSPAEAKQLLLRYRLGLCSDEEKQVVEQWYAYLSERSADVLSEEEMTMLQNATFASIRDKMVVNAPSRIGKLQKISHSKWYWAAAGLVFLVGISYFFLKFYQKNDWKNLPVTARYHNDLPPGKYDADWSINGQKTITMSQVMGLKKDGDGFFHVESRESVGNTIALQNTITTHIGEICKLVLEDGTKVWLNAGSSISFKMPFDKSTRQVELNGEAYFEVVKNASRPFIVHGQSYGIRVLGTHFLVNDQDKILTKVSLLEGSIRLGTRAAMDSILMQPGETVSMNASQTDKTADSHIGDAVSWTKGYFNFNNAGIRETMDQLAKWYGLQVIYQETQYPYRFFGELPMDSPLSDVLKVLETTGVKFMIKDHTVTVL